MSVIDIMLAADRPMVRAVDFKYLCHELVFCTWNYCSCLSTRL